MILSDFHTHTTFSDGKNTPEEMVLAAIDLGLESIGFSDHSYTHFDESYCIAKDNIENYRNTVHSLKNKYSGKINIYCGIEQDFYSCEETRPFDYAIGSVHYIKIGDEYISIDESIDSFKTIAQNYFSGDYISFAEKYFETVGDVIKQTGADIIGHFDLISKYNRAGLFDESDERYVTAWKTAVDKLLVYGKPFEINTGGIFRGYKDCPYPSPNIVNYIKQNGGKIILSSDAHNINGLCFKFDTISAFFEK